MKKLLITGFMRSGTTFLANFLNSQNDCLIYRDFLLSIFRTARKLGVSSFLSNLNLQQKSILLSELKAESRAIGSNMFDGFREEFSCLKELYESAFCVMNRNNNCKWYEPK